ncbi:YihY/virulence factor BrkB family protein [Rubrivivax gelatinosus]|uniref:Putative ribonuclease n=1 Tax=Rubrivivax gelatinosus (strain NBRC 100245 / IL144) TaxID=983917 RepID=I0HTY2_RUBGI|nr:YihY/virulence factor BrkB family protein [Rubrivivax gelatinosus]BAL96469.1 putative ribonuclease [Rubrivivax gelatinosus IL144]
MQHASPSPARPGPRDWLSLARRAFDAWLQDYAPSMGAALAYYTVFSLGPVMLLVISIAGLVFGEEAAQRALFGELQRLMGHDAAEAVQAVLATFRDGSRAGTGTAIGLVLLLVGATTVFAELQDALDRIWRAPTRGRPSGPWALVRARFLSFGLILGIAFLLMVSLVLSAAVSALGTWWGTWFGAWELLAQALNLVLGFAITTLVFALIYKLMPRVKVRWLDVWLGAAITAALFSLGQVLIGLYIGKTGVASGWGAAGSLVIVFVWVYWAAQVFLLGAEFTWVYAKTWGSMRGLATPPPAEGPAPAAGEAATAAPRTALEPPGAALPPFDGRVGASALGRRGG